MPIKLYQSGFAVGQISPASHGRVDIDRYALAAKRIENWEVTPIGTLRRRAGTRSIAFAKFPARDVRLEPFEFSIEQAYALEIGHLYIRFYRDANRIDSPPLTPVEVVTPYDESELFDLQVIQSADVMYFAHPAHPPARLIRIDDTDWRYEVIPLSPQPILEKPIPIAGVSVTPDALSGQVRLTANTLLWLEADVGRTFFSGTTEAVITDIIPEAFGAPYPSAQAFVQTISPFTALGAIAPGDWTLSSTPGLDLRISGAEGATLGGAVTLHIESDELPTIIFANVPASNNLVTSGDFAVLTGWEDQSGRVIADGNHNGGSPPQPELVDDTKDFVLEGVEPGHRVLNVSTASEGLVGIIRSIPGATNANSVIDLNPMLAPTGPDWQAAELYEIRETGSITHDTVAGELQIRGGKNGRGAIGQQASANGQDTRFLVEVDVRRQPVIIQVGSTAPPKFGAAIADLVPETTLEVGTQRVVFKTDSLTNAYVQFSNTQDIDSHIDNVVVFPFRRTGWRASDVGKLVRVAGGLVEIRSFIDPFRVNGVVRALFSDPVNDDGDLIIQAGLWRLGEAAWSAVNGYPRAITIHQQRLWLAGSGEQPLTLWASRTADFANFNIGPDDSDALELEISANQMNSVRWLEPLGDLLVGTAGGEHLIQGGTAGITPSNAFQSPQTTFGSSGTRPIRHDNVLYLLARGNHDVWEVTTDGDTGLLNGRNVTRLAPDITVSGVKEWSLQSWPDHILRAIRSDGKMVGLTLDLSENLRAWHQHTTLGRFLSHAVVPSANNLSERLEQVYYAVSRGEGASQRVLIEFAEARIDRAADVREPYTLDSAARIGLPSGPATITEMTGFFALEGETVAIVERRLYIRPDGRFGERWTNHGTAVVTGGVVTFPQAVASADVGLPIVPHLELLRPNIDLRDGNLQFREQRILRVFLRTIDTVGFLTVNGEALDVRLPEDLMDTGFPPEDVDLSTRSIAGWDGDGFVVVTQPLSFPSHILSIGIELQAEEME